MCLSYLELSLMSMAGDASQPLLTLTETETVFILSLDSSIVANDSKDLEAIKQQNERFIEVMIEGRDHICPNLISFLFSYVRIGKAVIYSVIVV